MKGTVKDIDEKDPRMATIDWGDHESKALMVNLHLVGKPELA
jgi:hypothetical protein